jgi:hypothetical protein
MISAASRLSSLVLIACVAACGGGGGGGGGGGSSAPQHLYVGDNAASPTVVLDEFTLPLATTSTPTASVPKTTGTVNVMSVAVDGSGNVVTGSSTGRLSVFSPPLTNSSASSIFFNNGASPVNTGQLAFGPGGKLFASDGSVNVNIFNPPLTGSTTASSSVTDASLTDTTGVAFDGAGNLYVANSGSSGSTLSVFASLYTGAATVVTPSVSTAAYRKIAIRGSQLFVGDIGTPNEIDVYNLPLTSTSAPAFSITSVDRPEALSFDGGGNLYVGNLGDTKVRVFAPPFSALSVPSVTFTAPVSQLFGLIVGN